MEQQQLNGGDRAACDSYGERKSYVETQLKRLEKDLRLVAKTRNPPSRKNYTPYTFNKLTPYCDVKTAKFLGHWPEVIRHGYVSRKTATGLCDPWIDLEMDKYPLPKIDSRALVQQTRKPAVTPRQPTKKEGSTRLPKFPVVVVSGNEFCDLSTKTLFYSDVPMLREKIAEQFGNGDKYTRDYIRTKQDFYRMELDRLSEYHRHSRSRAKDMYKAYLENSLGSKKALEECIQKAEEHIY